MNLQGIRRGEGSTSVTPTATASDDGPMEPLSIAPRDFPTAVHPLTGDATGSGSANPDEAVAMMLEGPLPFLFAPKGGH